MNGHKHQEKEALGRVCVCALGYVVWCRVPGCLCFFRSMATEHSGLQSVLDVSMGLVKPAGPCQLPSAKELLLLCTSDRAEQGEYQNRSSGMGTDFPINL